MVVVLLFRIFCSQRCFLMVIGAIGWASWQYSYQEQAPEPMCGPSCSSWIRRKSSNAVLSEIRNALKGGVAIAGSTGTPRDAGIASAFAGKILTGANMFFIRNSRVATTPETQPDYATGDWLIRI